MKLSNDTVAVLKNFAAINSNLVVNEGSTVKTISEAKNILATATISESFPTNFGIYDLNEFLGVMSMFDSPELQVADDNNSAIIKQDKRSVKYFFSDPSILTSPSKDIVMPDPEVTFKLTNDDMNALKRASSTLGVTDVIVNGVANENKVTLQVTDVRDATANSFELELDECTRSTEAFKFVFNIANFKFVPGDYNVAITSKLISHFKNANVPVEYWVALEKTSTFGG